METLKMTIKAEIATAQENILKEDINKLFERVFLKEYSYTSERMQSSEEVKTIELDKSVLVEIIYQFSQSSNENARKVHKLSEGCASWEQFYFDLEKMPDNDLIKLTEKIFL